ncbi:HAD family hydrolase [halophilic archaeon]|nr:HAD family hydrolase [halophilic archaeon]
MCDDVSAVVYDLDGTLVDLVVDWDAVAEEVAAVLGEGGVDASDADLWAMLDLADEAGLRPEVEAVIGDHECDGARNSTRLRRADELLDLTVPVGVCSLNCESACRVGLETHDLASSVDAVVGRDSVATRKPDPEPLLATLDALGVDGDAVFVGDSRRDELTAERAGVAFEWV